MNYAYQLIYPVIHISTSIGHNKILVILQICIIVVKERLVIGLSVQSVVSFILPFSLIKKKFLSFFKLAIEENPIGKTPLTINTLSIFSFPQFQLHVLVC